MVEVHTRFVRQQSLFGDAAIVLGKSFRVLLPPSLFSHSPDKIAQVPLKGFREVDIYAARFIQQFAVNGQTDGTLRRLFGIDLRAFMRSDRGCK